MRFRVVRRAAASAVVVLAVLGSVQLVLGAGGGHSAKRTLGGTVTPPPDHQLEKKIPAGVDVFDLSLAQTRAYSARQNFKVVGHSYLKGPWLTDTARQFGLGAGFNTLRVHDGIAYLAGYNTPATLFGVLIADVRDPKHIQPLSFIPCNPGARCAYLRLNEQRHILVVGNDISGANPNKPPAGEPVKSGLSFYDVSDPANPQRLGFLSTEDNGETHGLTIDDRHVYACASDPADKPIAGGDGNQELKIVDYSDPANPTQVSSVHIQGQRIGEDYGPDDQLNPNGSAQKVVCHEPIVHGNLVYVSWRDAGMVIVDVSDPANPKIVSRRDYVPPFNGGALGASHTSAPVVTGPGRPTLVVQTDEIFDCPPGFGRIVDVSDLAHPQILSSFRIPAIDDNYDASTGKFKCEAGLQSIHLPWFDYRSPSLLYVSWYDQGLRAWNISNPFLPREVGYYISPKYAPPAAAYPPDLPPFFYGKYRSTREVYQDPQTGLIYITDGNGGGLTVLRWTGPVPKQPPLPGSR
jgi:hypothetical protein